MLFDTSGNREPPAVPPEPRRRRTSVIDEFRERNRHRNFGLTLKQSFGGSGSGAGWRSRTDSG